MSPSSPLTAAQRIFAVAHSASRHVVAGSGRGVYVYREEGLMTDRWLLADDGRVLEYDLLRRDPGA